MTGTPIGSASDQPLDPILVCIEHRIRFGSRHFPGELAELRFLCENTHTAVWKVLDEPGVKHVYRFLLGSFNPTTPCHACGFCRLVQDRRQENSRSSFSERSSRLDFDVVSRRHGREFLPFLHTSICNAHRWAAVLYEKQKLDSRNPTSV